MIHKAPDPAEEVARWIEPLEPLGELPVFSDFDPVRMNRKARQAFLCYSEPVMPGS